MSDNWFQRRLLKNDVTALSTLQNQSDITLKSCHSGKKTSIKSVGYLQKIRGVTDVEQTGQFYRG